MSAPITTPPDLPSAEASEWPQDVEQEFLQSLEAYLADYQQSLSGDIRKAVGNPFHDQGGRFTSKDNAVAPGVHDAGAGEPHTHVGPGFHANPSGGWHTWFVPGISLKDESTWPLKKGDKVVLANWPNEKLNGDQGAFFWGFYDDGSAKIVFHGKKDKLLGIYGTHPIPLDFVKAKSKGGWSGQWTESAPPQHVLDAANALKPTGGFQVHGKTKVGNSYKTQPESSSVVSTQPESPGSPSPKAHVDALQSTVTHQVTAGPPTQPAGLMSPEAALHAAKGFSIGDQVILSGTSETTSMAHGHVEGMIGTYGGAKWKHGDWTQGPTAIVYLGNGAPLSDSNKKTWAWVDPSQMQWLSQSPQSQQSAAASKFTMGDQVHVTGLSAHLNPAIITAVGSDAKHYDIQLANGEQFSDVDEDELTPHIHDTRFTEGDTVEHTNGSIGEITGQINGKYKVTWHDGYGGNLVAPQDLKPYESRPNDEHSYDDDTDELSHTPAPAESAPSNQPTTLAALHALTPVHGPTGGTAPGQWYQAPDGSKFYSKQIKSEKLAYNEVAADTLYQLGGATVPPVNVIAEDGKHTIVSKLVPGYESKTASWWTSPAAETARKSAQAHWGLDVLMQHYDVVGPKYDNLLVNNAGDVLRVEGGGALAATGYGNPKPGWDTATDQAKQVLSDAISMRGNGAHQNSHLKAVFGDMSNEVAATQLEIAAMAVQHQIVSGALANSWKAAGVPQAQIALNLQVLNHKLDAIPAVVKQLTGKSPIAFFGSSSIGQVAEPAIGQSAATSATPAATSGQLAIGTQVVHTSDPNGPVGTITRHSTPDSSGMTWTTVDWGEPHGKDVHPITNLQPVTSPVVTPATESKAWLTDAKHGDQVVWTNPGISTAGVNSGESAAATYQEPHSFKPQQHWIQINGGSLVLPNAEDLHPASSGQPLAIDTYVTVNKPSSEYHGQTGQISYSYAGNAGHIVEFPDGSESKFAPHELQPASGPANWSPDFHGNQYTGGLGSHEQQPSPSALAESEEEAAAAQPKTGLVQPPVIGHAKVTDVHGKPKKGYTSLSYGTPVTWIDPVTNKNKYGLLVGPTKNNKDYATVLLPPIGKPFTVAVSELMGTAHPFSQKVKDKLTNPYHLHEGQWVQIGPSIAGQPNTPESGTKGKIAELDLGEGLVTVETEEGPVQYHLAHVYPSTATTSYGAASPPKAPPPPAQPAGPIKPPGTADNAVPVHFSKFNGDVANGWGVKNPDGSWSVQYQGQSGKAYAVTVNPENSKLAEGHVDSAYNAAVYKPKPPSSFGTSTSTSYSFGPTPPPDAVGHQPPVVPATLATKKTASPQLWKEGLDGAHKLLGQIAYTHQFATTQSQNAMKKGAAETLWTNHPDWLPLFGEAYNASSSHSWGLPANGGKTWEQLSEAEQKKVVGELVWDISHSWNGSSTGNVAFQLAVAKEFSLPEATVSQGHLPGLSSAQTYYQKYGAAYRIVARCIYEHTQARLAKEGIKYVTVTRYMHGTGIPNGERNVTFRPINSFACVDHPWAGSGASHMFTAVFPASMVFSFAGTGPGTIGEHELVMLGGEQLPVSVGSSSYHHE